MQASDIPSRIQLPFANAGLKNAIPVTASPTPGLASYTEGFPSETMQPIASGGIPPAGQDFNGVLFDTTGWSRWVSAGGAVPWNSTFSTAIGGYPAGARVQSATVVGKFYLSTADNNTTDPDAGGAGWVIVGGAATGQQVFTSSGTFTVPGGVTQVKIRAWGAGGGGGGSASAAGSFAGPGGGGEYREAIFAVTPGAALTVTVGAGGTAGTGGGSPTAGGAGGNSSVTGRLTAAGGNGGSGANGAPIQGGTGGTGGSFTSPIANSSMTVSGTGAGIAYEVTSGAYVLGAPGYSFGTPAVGPTVSAIAVMGFAGVFPGGGAGAGALSAAGGVGGGGCVIFSW